MSDISDRARELLRNLGWNIGNFSKENGITTIELFEHPFHSSPPSVRRLQLNGLSENAAVEEFLDVDIEVRIVGQEKTRSLLTGACTAELRVVPTTPRPGEEDDEWIILQHGDTLSEFPAADEMPQFIFIKRREARLLNVDSNGRRIRREK